MYRSKRGQRTWRYPLLTTMAAWVCCLPLMRPTPALAQDTPVRVGAYYFHGWSGETSHVTDLLRNDFGDRKPVWGWTVDSVEAVEREIDLCADHGISFWAFCWYYPEAQNKDTPLNDALEMFLQADNRHRMDFCLLVANHAGHRIGPAEWNVCSDRWLELFRSPRHLTLGGKPLLVIFSPREIIDSFETPENVRNAFDALRSRAKKQGLPGVAIAACTGPVDYDELTACGFDVLTGYNYNFSWETGATEQPFGRLIDKSVAMWDRFAETSPLPYIPVATIGWDRRPWELGTREPDRLSTWYTDRTPEKVERFIRRGVQWLDEHERAATHERLLLLYAWNEMGEGGYLTPTEKDGTSYLEAVRRGFEKAESDAAR